MSQSEIHPTKFRCYHWSRSPWTPFVISEEKQALLRHSSAIPKVAIQNSSDKLTSGNVSVPPLAVRGEPRVSSPCGAMHPFSLPRPLSIILHWSLFPARIWGWWLSVLAAGHWETRARLVLSSAELW